MSVNITYTMLANWKIITHHVGFFHRGTNFGFLTTPYKEVVYWNMRDSLKSMNTLLYLNRPTFVKYPFQFKLRRPKVIQRYQPFPKHAPLRTRITVVPVLRDHCHERPPLLKDHFFKHQHSVIHFCLWRATTHKTRPATTVFDRKLNKFTCYKRPPWVLSVQNLVGQFRFFLPIKPDEHQFIF